MEFTKIKKANLNTETILIEQAFKDINKFVQNQRRILVHKIQRLKIP